jgi:hypothetical protein
MRSNLQSFCNFLWHYKERVALHSIAISAYGTLCYKARKWENETLRMGVAGSLAHGTVEALFHFVDTVNIKSKAAEGVEHHSFPTMVKRIWATEGIMGFARGLGAAVYGNYTCGFIYFYIYKWLKNNMPELGGAKAFLAGFMAETCAIMYKFPFDLIKCRL